jgi:hypothetical protein
MLHIVRFRCPDGKAEYDRGKIERKNAEDGKGENAEYGKAEYGRAEKLKNSLPHVGGNAWLSTHVADFGAMFT